MGTVLELVAHRMEGNESSGSLDAMPAHQEGGSASAGEGRDESKGVGASIGSEGRTTGGGDQGDVGQSGKGGDGGGDQEEEESEGESEEEGTEGEVFLDHFTRMITAKRTTPRRKHADAGLQPVVLAEASLM